MNITRCGKEHLVLTIITAIVSSAGIGRALLGAISGFNAFELLPIVAIAALGASIVLAYRRNARVPKWMFYLWVLPQAICVQITTQVDGQLRNIIPSFSILGDGHLALQYMFDPDNGHGISVGFYALSFILLVVFMLFLEEWDDEKAPPELKNDACTEVEARRSDQRSNGE